MVMLVVSLFQWWYGDGLRERIKFASVRLESLIDYFSFSLLLKTLFSPYRQISAGKVDGSLEVQLRAFVDKLFSRVIGAVIRLIIMIVGFVVLILAVVYTLLTMILWLALPALPLLGVWLMFIGWNLPWTI